MNLKIGGNDVGKIMFNGQEFGGSHKSGDVLYVAYRKTVSDSLIETVPFKIDDNDKVSVTYLSGGGVAYLKYQEVEVLGKNLSVISIGDYNGTFQQTSDGWKAKDLYNNSNCVIVKLV